MMSRERLSLLDPEERYSRLLEGTVFEDDLSRERRAKALNETELHADAGNMGVTDPLRGFGTIGTAFGALIGGVLGLIFAGLGTIGGWVALRKLKNLMSRVIYWTEFGNDRGGKGKHKNVSAYNNVHALWTTWNMSETTKDRQSFASNVMGASRSLLTQVEQLREMMGAAGK